ncbi:sugar ABC transporter ATP-binding protein, partial [Xylella fastidiosa subsp. multiplex]|nr:sugar ABC transporter ATP-binding protein [Xylella fastidiosa subsp. multiplex]
GRDRAWPHPDRNAGGEREPVLEVERFTVPGYAQDAGFSLRKGEILGFAGLVGAGRTELMEGVLGLRAGRGTIRHLGKPVHFAKAED